MNSANVLLQHEVPGKTNFLHVNATTETWFKTFIAGGVAGVVSRTVVSPLERIKILFQVRTTIWNSEADTRSRRRLTSLASRPSIRA